MAAEADRIGDCLEWIARLPRDVPDEFVSKPGGQYSERLLYTWGPEVKISRMREDPYFCDYELARQNEFEYRKFLSYQLPEFSWGRPRGLRTITDIDERYKAIIAAPDDFPDESAEELKGLSVQFALGRLYDPGGSADDRSTRIREQASDYEGLKFSPKKARADGRNAAHNMAAGSRTSSIKGGLGVYFSAHPFRFFAESEGRTFGLVCRLPGQRTVIDRLHQASNDFLAEHHIIYRGSQKTVDGGALVPTIENPALFDRAARGRFILRLPLFISGGREERESAYVDKCSLPYDNSSVCQPVSLQREWLSCDNFMQVVGLRKDPRRSKFAAIDFMTVDNPNGRIAEPMLKFFVEQSDGDLLRDRFLECYGEAYSSKRHGKVLPGDRAELRAKLDSD